MVELMGLNKNDLDNLERIIKKAERIERGVNTWSIGNFVVGMSSLYYGLSENNDSYINMGYGFIIAGLAIASSYYMPTIIKKLKGKLK